LVKNDSVKVTYWLRKVELDNILTMAKYLYDIKVIPRPTGGTFSKTAVAKMFNELSKLMAKEKEQPHLDEPSK
jgi:hypothetical protein